MNRLARAIRSDPELARAIALADELLGRDDLGECGADLLDALGDVIEEYESDRHPMPPVSDAELLAHLIESRGETASAVSAGSGVPESEIAGVLAGGRSLGRESAGKLSDYFGINQSIWARDGRHPTSPA